MMKHFIGVGVLAVLALGSRFRVSQRFALDVCIHGTYRVISIRMIRALNRNCRAEVWPRSSVVASWLLDLNVSALRGDPAVSKFAFSALSFQ